ncbi:MAG: hypothetical protein ACI87E_005150 [Mariniblastus sp.]|jgi:hypothetical protein
MKKVVSISLGSSQRNHETTVSLLGQQVHIRRIGVDGDFTRARELFLELDGEVDVFGMGGCEFGLNFDGRNYPLRAVAPLIDGVDSPVVDGSGIRAVVERSLGSFVERNVLDANSNKRVLFCVSAARYDMVLGFQESGYRLKFGDPGFVLGLPIGSGSFWLAKLAGRVFIPLVVRAPFAWLYPTGSSQLVNKPRFRSWFQWSDVIADDFLYIKRFLPERIEGKIIVTNTTTLEDREMLRARGAKCLVTSTPRLEGRSFGTNVFEAAITAAVGKSRKLTQKEMEQAIKTIGFEPQVTWFD